MNIPDDSNPYESYKVPYKVIIVGDSSVGKTTLIRRLDKNEFFEDIDSTVGSNTTKILYNYDNHDIEFQIFDTAGQEKYQSIVKFYLKNTTVSLICFNPMIEGWINSVKQWYTLVINECPETRFILIATKYDLWKENIKIKSIKSEIAKVSNIEDIIYVSSLSGENIKNLLNLMAQNCEESNIKKSISESVNLKNQQNDKKCSCF